MMRLYSWIDNRIIQNLFVWVFFFLILLISTTSSDGNVALLSLYVVLLLAPPVYINNLLILPYFKNKRSLFFIYFILNSIVFSIVYVFLIITISEKSFELKMLTNFFGIMILVLAFASTIKIARDSFINRHQEKEAQLKLLKAQLNPHFLFNTLNNLYGLSVVKSDKLPALMLKLSDLLRYSLYDTKETVVPLEQEINYLENYISLEKIRLEDKTDIQFTKSGNFSSKKIAPMLFIVFVENAFKHLATLDIEKSKVAISIKEENDSIIFKCENSIDKFNLKEENLEKGKSGIGLQNAKKRLALIYPEKHTLTIHENNGGLFSVELIINL